MQPSAGQTLDSAPVRDPLIGRTVAGRYRIHQMIGRGGVGLVYLARDLKPDGGADDVVIKVLSPDWNENTQVRARFEREVDRLSALHHPNIVRLLDYGTLGGVRGSSGGLAYMVMEYAEGITLEDHLKQRGPLELSEFVPIAAQVLKAMGYAHSRGLMHRDIKPSNIMLCIRNGRGNFVKVLDFGLAKLITGEERQITDRHIIGTVGYLSPEQITGGSLDVRVDVYALGVLFYFMMSGRMPLAAENNAALMYAHVHDDPAPLDQVLPAGRRVPRGVSAMIMQCLAKDREARLGNADAMVECLIDCCPASMFHLPLASDGTVARPGMTLKARRDSVFDDDLEPGESASVTIVPPTGINETVRSMRRAPGRPQKFFPVVQTESVPVARPRSSFDFAPAGALAEPPTRSRSWWLVGGAAAAVLIGGLLMFGLRAASDGAGDDAVVLYTDEGSLRRALNDAELEVAGHLEAGEYNEANAVIDRLAPSVKKFPALTGRLDRLQLQVKVARLLTTAKGFEDAGNERAALAAYKDVMDLDPANPVARERIAALDKTNKDQAKAKAAVGRIELASSPEGAELMIDGTAVGTTPYSGELPVGEHTLVVSLRGYRDWSERIEITADGNHPIDAQLTRRGRARTGGADADRPSAPKRDVDQDPEPKKPSKPMFMSPSKSSKKQDSSGGGVFLPVGKGQ